MSDFQLALRRTMMPDLQPKDNGRLLVERAQADPKAFGLLFDRHHDEIFIYILHRTANAELARDLTSQTFFNALNKLHTFRWKNIPFSAWLYRIASNEVNGYFRKYKNFKNVPLQDITDEPGAEFRELKEEILEADRELERNFLFMDLHRAVSRLAAKYQEVITLHYFEHKKISEISLILNKSVGTVKSLLHRAIKKLQKFLEAGTVNDVIKNTDGASNASVKEEIIAPVGMARRDREANR